MLGAQQKNPPPRRWVFEFALAMSVLRAWLVAAKLSDVERSRDLLTCGVAADPDVVLTGWCILNGDHWVETNGVVITVPGAARIVDHEGCVAACLDIEAKEVRAARTLVVQDCVWSSCCMAAAA